MSGGLSGCDVGGVRHLLLLGLEASSSIQSHSRPSQPWRWRGPGGTLGTPGPTILGHSSPRLMQVLSTLLPHLTIKPCLQSHKIGARARILHSKSPHWASQEKQSRCHVLNSHCISVYLGFDQQFVRTDRKFLNLVDSVFVNICGCIS